MAVRRGPNHALISLYTSVDSLLTWSGNAFNGFWNFLLVPVSNSLTSLPTGTTATTATTGAYGTTGGTYYYYKLIDVVSGLF